MNFTVNINGVTYPLLKDLRFFMLEYFSHDYVLYDLQHVPPTVVEVYVDGPEAGITKRKLLPNGNYSAAIRRFDSALYPSHPPVCLYVLGLPPSTTNSTLWSIFSKFGDVKEAEVFQNFRSNCCNGRGYVEYYDPTTVLVVPKVISFGSRLPLNEIFVEVGYQLPERREEDTFISEDDPLFRGGDFCKDEDMGHSSSCMHLGMDGYLGGVPYIRTAPIAAGGSRSNRGDVSCTSEISGIGGGGVMFGGGSPSLFPSFSLSSSFSSSPNLSGPPVPSFPLQSRNYLPSSSALSSPYAVGGRGGNGGLGAGVALQHPSPSRSPQHLRATGGSGVSLQSPAPLSVPSLTLSPPTPTGRPSSQQKMQRRSFIHEEFETDGIPSPPPPVAVPPCIAGNKIPSGYGYSQKPGRSEGLGNTVECTAPNMLGTGFAQEACSPPFFASVSSPKSLGAWSGSSSLMSSASHPGIEMAGMDLTSTQKSTPRDPQWFIVHFSSDKEAQTALAEQRFFTSSSSDIALLSISGGNDNNTNNNHSSSNNGTDSHGTNSNGPAFIIFTTRKKTAFFGVASLLYSYRAMTSITHSNETWLQTTEGSEETGMEERSIQWILYNVCAPINHKASGVNFSDSVALPSGTELTRLVGKRVWEYLQQFEFAKPSAPLPSSLPMRFYSPIQRKSGGKYSKGGGGMVSHGPFRGAIDHNRNRFISSNNNNSNNRLRDRGVRKRYSPRGRGFRGGRGRMGMEHYREIRNENFDSTLEEGERDIKTSEEKRVLSSYSTTLRPIGEDDWPPKPIMY